MGTIFQGLFGSISLELRLESSNGITGCKRMVNACAYAKIIKIKIITNENTRLATLKIIAKYTPKNSNALKKNINFISNSKNEGDKICLSENILK